MMKAKSQQAAQVFRQFAWNLAGTLASNRPQRPNAQRPAPQGKRG